MANLAKIPIVKQRRLDVMEMLLEGKSHTQISDVIKHNYQKTEHTVQKDITVAYAMIRQSHDVSYEALVGRHIGMYYDLYQTAKELGDVKGAIAATQAIEKLLKMHQPDNATFVQNNNYNLEHLTDLQIDKILDEAKLIEKE